MWLPNDTPNPIFLRLPGRRPVLLAAIFARRANLRRQSGGKRFAENGLQASLLRAARRFITNLDF
jgi:hypothetical protein